MKTETQHALTHDLRPDPGQPRKTFPPEMLAERRESIQANGIKDPLIVRADPEKKTKWLIVDGECRWRCARELKLDRVPIAPREFKTEGAVREYQRIVGTQRANVSALEEAAALQAQLELCKQRNPKFSVTDLAEQVGRSRATVYELLSLLKLPEPIREALRAGALNASQAVRIGTVQNPDSQQRLVEEVKAANERAEPVSVRKLEKQIAATAVKRPAHPAGSLPKAKAVAAEARRQQQAIHLREQLARNGEDALERLKRRCLSKPMPEAVWGMIAHTLMNGILNEQADGYGQPFAAMCGHYGVKLAKPKPVRKTSPRKNARNAKKKAAKK